MTQSHGEGRFGGPPGSLEELRERVRSLDIERRATRHGVADLAARDLGSKIRVTGHAAVFDSLSEDLGGFRERIQRGAFAYVLRDDVRFLINHEGLPLARTANGTLRLEEDRRGLAITADLAPTTQAHDLATLIRRGDVDQMSFAFRMDQRLGARDVWDTTDEGALRTVIAVSHLFDVSAVTFPAYQATDLSLLKDAA